jgi:ornithine--oxo-acid transaminase
LKGLGRTGKMLACDWEEVRPDVLVLGKALSGGMYPVSAVLTRKEVMLCIRPGEHGSTYGGNPLGCAVAIAALQVLRDEDLPGRARVLGARLLAGLQALQTEFRFIAEVRGRGLMTAIVVDPKFSVNAWDLCLLLRDGGLLAKPTHETAIRLSPPLVLTEADVDAALAIIRQACVQAAVKGIWKTQ